MSGGLDETALLRKTVTMCGHLSVLAAQSTDVDAIARYLFDNLESAVAIIDRGLEVLAFAGFDRPGAVLELLRSRNGASGLSTVLAAAARNRRALTVPSLGTAGSWVVVAPVSVGDDVSGYLVVAGERTSELRDSMRLMVAEHAATICGVVLGRELVVAAAASRARQQLLEGLLLATDRDDREVEQWARHLGLDPAREYYVMTVAVSGHRREQGLSAVEALMVRLVREAIVVGRDEEVVAVAPVRRPDSGSTRPATRHELSLARRCADGISKRGLGPVAIGIGNPCRSPAGISRSYVEARRALAASERLGEFGGVTAFADLGIQRLFLEVPNVADLRRFAEEVVGALLDEQGGGATYLETLGMYFDENGSPQRAAKRLHVHPNTVTYRIRRIEQITGLSLDVHKDRLMAEVAVEILDVLRSPR